ncbi:hypothetical protein BGZ72_001974 [Mortierella alpina]|nr:hypothetical protein BGZ72_001974 [Mortierella alpina]
MSFSGVNKSAHITGTLERVPVESSQLPYPGNALPPNSTITIVLEDVSLMDAPSTVIAKTAMQTGTSPNGQKFPIPFKLAYRTSLIKSGARYNIGVRVETNATKTLVWISPNYNPVLPPSKNLRILLDEVAIFAGRRFKK